MAISDVTDGDFEEKVLKSDKPVIVDFWAPWCAPCKLAEPILEELSETHKDKITFMKINVDENTESAGNYDVMSIPTTILFKGGQQVDRQIGFAGRQAFENLLKRAS